MTIKSASEQGAKTPAVLRSRVTPFTRANALGAFNRREKPAARITIRSTGGAWVFIVIMVP